MEAIVGRYRLQMEGFCIILTHTTRFRFEMTLDEALGLMEFIQNFQAAGATAQGDAEPSVLSAGSAPLARRYKGSRKEAVTASSTPGGKTL
jgi:hypothetical protein